MKTFSIQYFKLEFLKKNYKINHFKILQSF